MSSSIEKEHQPIDLDRKVETEILKVHAAVVALLEASKESKSPPLAEIQEMMRKAEGLLMVLRLRLVEVVSGKSTFLRAVDAEGEKFGAPLRFEIVKLLAKASDQNCVMTVREIADELETTPDVIKSHIPYLRDELKELGLHLARYDDVAQLDNRGWKERFTGYRLTWQALSPELARERKTGSRGKKTVQKAVRKVVPEVEGEAAPARKDSQATREGDGVPTTKLQPRRTPRAKREPEPEVKRPTPPEEKVNSGKPQQDPNDPNSVLVLSDAGRGYARIPKRPVLAF